MPSAPVPAPAYTLLTFGCKVNLYESEGLRRDFAARGWREISPRDALAPDTSPPALAVVNSCAVTARAENEVRRAVRRFAARHIPVAFTGCAASMGAVAPAWVRELPPNVHLIDNAEKSRLPARFALASSPSSPPGPDDGRDARFDFAVDRFAGHARAFLKIQDGCDNHCAYCLVPRARGRPASRPASAVLAEAERLAAAGHREINLTGIHIGAYRDADGLTLPGLLRLLGTHFGGGMRWRLGSVEPGAVTDALAAAMAEAPGVLPHVHIPLQSGDDGVLARMHRRHTASDVEDAVARLRRALDDPGIGLDVIVGFPGEDAAAFARTRAVCERVAAGRGHVFPFSARPGTAAATMGPMVPRAEADARRAELTALFARQAEAFARRRVGTTVETVAERRARHFDDGTPWPTETSDDPSTNDAENTTSKITYFSGYTERYERIHFSVPATCGVASGRTVRVRVRRAERGELWGDADFFPNPPRDDEE